jgi:hypothetical protein
MKNKTFLRKTLLVKYLEGIIMQNRNPILLGVILIITMIFLFAPAVFSKKAPEIKVETAIANLEKVILRASDLYENGNIQQGNPYIAMIAPKVKISFSKENFDADLKKAFGVYDKLIIYRNKMKPSEKTSTPSKQSPSKKNAPDDKIAALMREERKMIAPNHRSKEKTAIQYSKYSIYKTYEQGHQTKVEQEDQSAEADMKTVIAERRAAETALQQRIKHKQELQSQATKWQGELDKQASASASAAAKWQAEHSFGAYTKRFFYSVLQTAVGSFGSAFLGTVATHYANEAVEKMFPDVDTSTLATQITDDANQTANQATQDSSATTPQY